MVAILDPYGKPFMNDERRALMSQLNDARSKLMKARYDAAQAVDATENHWSQADHLDPHSAASAKVRKTLRSRSRYEVLENNPFLKGVLLTLCNDFVGTGPKLKITDKRLSPDRRRAIEKRWLQWSQKIKLRQKLWRMRLAKITDGETFARAYTNPKLMKKFPIGLDFQVLEADRVSSEYIFPVMREGTNNEIDGVRFDGYENPLEYHVLHSHPGSSLLWNILSQRAGGTWIDEKLIVHWFRQDRGWLRGIPETTPSLPLCAILRRYTLAMLRHAEISAAFTAIIETENPGATNPWTDGQGTQLLEDPFDVFPIEMGMITNVPWGYKMKQFNPVPLGDQFDSYVGAMLRLIVRPLLAPWNIAAGTSKESNMASAVVDQDIYKGGQKAERLDCNEDVLDPMVELFWAEGTRTSGFFGDEFLQSDPQFRDNAPEHRWRWDRIGLDHTDPMKVAKALVELRTNLHITDADIQEEYFNRDVDDWREEIAEDEEFRSQFVPEPPEPEGATEDEPEEEPVPA